jgi:hypothetical protein
LEIEILFKWCQKFIQTAVYVGDEGRVTGG